jgi:hypothetical protein
MTEHTKDTDMGHSVVSGRRIYVASSWRNPVQPAVVEALRSDGHDVYDFRNPTEGNTGFSWHKIDPSVPAGPADLRLPADQIRTMLAHPEADDGFALDMGALKWCDTCVLVLPSGRSAHLEAGWATGAGKYTVVLLDEGEPDLMWKMCDALCVSLAEVRTVLKRDSSVVSHAPCLKDDPGAPEGGIPCCSGCACTCGSDFPFPCECMDLNYATSRYREDGKDG